MNNLDVAHPTSAVLLNHRDRTARTAALVDQLHAIVEELEAMHPGRKFPLDGHLVGSIGEAAAEVIFELSLVATSSTGHDAVAMDGRKVEIKATYGTRGVAIRQTSHGAAAALVVLRLSRSANVNHEIVFNGPLEVALQAAGRVGSNGQSSMSLTRLRALNKSVEPGARTRIVSRRTEPWRRYDASLIISSGGGASGRGCRNGRPLQRRT